MGGIAIGTQGDIYIDDTNNGRIRRISAAGQVSTFAGKETKGFVDGDTSVAEFARSTRQEKCLPLQAIPRDMPTETAQWLNSTTRPDWR